MEYAVYRGEEFLFIDTRENVMKKMGWSINKMYEYASNYYKRNYPTGYCLVSLNPLFSEEEKYELDMYDDTTRFKVYKGMLDYKTSDIEVLASKLGIKETQVKYHLNRLKEDGYDV